MKARLAVARCGLLAAVIACGEPEQKPNRVTIVVGTAPAVAAVTNGDGTLARLVCGDGHGRAQPPHFATCGGGEIAVLLARAVPPVVVTLKQPGHRFVTVEYPDFGKFQYRIDPPILPAQTTTADFATGIASPAQFADMAHTASSELGPVLAVKFYVDAALGDAPKVWFQHTKKHPLHYPFAQQFGGFVGKLGDFEAQAYKGANRQKFAGTVVHYPQQALKPYLVTFFPSDDLTPLQAAHAHRLLEERLPFLILAQETGRLHYLPASQHQAEQAEVAKQDLQKRDVPWLTHAQLHGDLKQQILNDGLAFGTLKRLSPEELSKTVVSYTDVVLLTRLPNGLPLVGGSITEELQTPLAHVNVSARARGTPNMALLGASDDPRVKPLLGKLVRFEVKGGGFTLAEATLQQAQAHWQQKKKPQQQPVFDLTLDGLPGLDDIGYANIKHVGAKAANVGELRKVVPEVTPDGFAVPFQWHDAFLLAAEVSATHCDGARTDCTQEGRAAAVCEAVYTLCTSAGKLEKLGELAARFEADAKFQADAVIREAALDGLRWIAKHVPLDPKSAQLLTNRASKVFGKAKFRLRSSSNSEDLPGFTGAGLYDSVSAYATGEKTIAGRIRDVWASIWTWRAHEERAFWGIDHAKVRMGVLASTAYPDEAANGVLITRNLADPLVAGYYVNVQSGEVPVTNPEGGAVPEVFTLVLGPKGPEIVRQRFSSLQPGKAILSDAEVAALFVAAYKIQQHFAPLYGVDPGSAAFDIEFKFVGPARKLVFKQCRPYFEGNP